MHLFWHSNLLTLARPTAGEERRRHEAAGCVFPHSLPYFPFGPRFAFVGSLLSGSAAAASLLHSTVNGRTMDFLSCKKNAMKLKKAPICICRFTYLPPQVSKSLLFDIYHPQTVATCINEMSNCFFKIRLVSISLKFNIPIKSSSWLSILIVLK